MFFRIKNTDQVKINEKTQNFNLIFFCTKKFRNVHLNQLPRFKCKFAVLNFFLKRFKKKFEYNRRKLKISLFLKLWNKFCKVAKLSLSWISSNFQKQYLGYQVEKRSNF